MKQVVFAFVGALAVIFAAVGGVIVDDARAQGLPDPDIPDAIHQFVEKIEGAASVDLIKSPGEFTGSNFVARVTFEPDRPGYKACPDHYPSYFVSNAAPCPTLRDEDPPASGWTTCYGAFYAPVSIGCPPEPQTPTAPATTPRPRCDFGPEICEKEAPGGPVLFRTLLVTPTRVLTPPAQTPVSPRIARLPEGRPPAAAGGRSRLAERPVVTQATQIPQAVTTAGQMQLQLRDRLTLQSNLLCRDGECQWGLDDAPITLPTPPVTPFKHVPCEYENVSFFVPENRYCPKETNGEQPAAGASVYISWEADNSSSPKVYYHRNDFDGVIRYLRQILGGSDDRYSIGDASERERAAARATAMLIKNEYVTPADVGTVTLGDDPSWPRLCGDERFSGLPQPGRCSGVKIGDRLVATSAHCVRNERQCAETSVVFGYYGDGATSASRTVASERVYQCVSVVASRRPASIGERGADWTIFEVDREIDAPNATLAGSADVRPSVVTTVIGHPLGLPAVVTRLGVVQTTTTEYFIANSDTFIGNSGSAVFAAQSVEDNAPRVLGLLTGGGYDFVDGVENGQECVQAKWCNGPECLGDDVVYADDLNAALSTYVPDP